MPETKKDLIVCLFCIFNLIKKDELENFLKIKFSKKIEQQVNIFLKIFKFFLFRHLSLK